jgi:homospermidine synthase
MVWALRNPETGIVEPEQVDFRTVLDAAMPYLGEVLGV